jgi:hypothetical protein
LTIAVIKIRIVKRKKRCPNPTLIQGLIPILYKKITPLWISQKTYNNLELILFHKILLRREKTKTKMRRNSPKMYPKS